MKKALHMQGENCGRIELSVFVQKRKTKAATVMAVIASAGALSLLTPSVSQAAPAPSFTKTSVGTFERGGTGVYRFEADNLTPEFLDGGFRDVLPAGFTVVSYDFPGGICGITPNNTAIDCQYNGTDTSPVVNVTVNIPEKRAERRHQHRLPLRQQCRGPLRRERHHHDRRPGRRRRRRRRGRGRRERDPGNSRRTLPVQQRQYQQQRLQPGRAEHH